MDSCLACCGIVRTPQLLAIHRYHFPCCQFLDGGYPPEEAFLEFFCVKMAEDAPEGIVGRNPAWQFEKCLKPGLFGTAKLLHRYPIIRSADGCADRNDQNVDQLVFAIGSSSWIAESSEIFDKPCLLLGAHWPLLCSYDCKDSAFSALVNFLLAHFFKVRDCPSLSCLLCQKSK